MNFKKPHPEQDLSFWIIGGGKFGMKAVNRLVKRFPNGQYTLVDKNTGILENIRDQRVSVIAGDAIDFLDRNLAGDRYRCPDWIIPAIPIHMAYEWIKKKLSVAGQFRPLPVPEELLAMLPNPIRGAEGQVYISNATWICPDNCPEPENICTHTGKPRPRILYRFLGNIRYGDFTSIVIRSHQLAPGVGGIFTSELFQVLSTAGKTRSPALFSTACACHGVMHGFQYSC